MERLCGYASCSNTDTPILITDKDRGYQQRFCSRAHAVAWLLGAIEKAGDTLPALLAYSGGLRVTSQRFDGRCVDEQFPKDAA